MSWIISHAISAVKSETPHTPLAGHRLTHNQPGKEGWAEKFK
jgi:hypothetical protein